MNESAKDYSDCKCRGCFFSQEWLCGKIARSIAEISVEILKNNWVWQSFVYWHVTTRRNSSDHAHQRAKKCGGNVYAKEWRGLGSFGYFEEQWLKWIKELKYLVFLPSSFLFYFCLVSFIFVVVFEYVKCVNLILPKPPPPLSSSECVKALLKVGQKVYSIPCFCYYYFFTLKVLGPSCTLLIRQLKKVIKLKEQQAKLKESKRELFS